MSQPSYQPQATCPVCGQEVTDAQYVWRGGRKTHYACAASDRGAPMSAHARVAVCSKCWHDVYLDGVSPASVVVDPRRFTIYDGVQFVVHRRAMIDPHVVAAVCGDIYTQTAVIELGAGA